MMTIMLTAKPPLQDKEPSSNTLLYIVLGLPMGMVDIGGGVILIPIISNLILNVMK